MKKTTLALFTVLAVVLLALPPASAPAWEWPKSLIITTVGKGNQYTNILGWSPVMEQQTGMKVRVIPQDVSALRQKWLKNGTVEMDFTTLGDVTFALEATQGHASRDGGPYHVRVAYLGMVVPRGYFVLASSSIKSIHDIKPGVRIAQPTGIPGIVRKNYALLAWIGLDKKDVVEVNFGSFNDSVKAVVEGKADITQAGTTSAVTYEIAANPRGIRMLPLPFKKEPDGARRYVDVNAVELFGTSTMGVKESIGLPTVIQPFFLYMSDKADPEVTYNLAKWFGENYDAYKDKEASLVTMSLDSFREVLDYSPIPVHEGTMRYLKEKGMWTAADDARQKSNVELVDRYIKAYQEAIAMADAKTIKVDPGNQEWIEMWENYKKELALPRLAVRVD